MGSRINTIMQTCFFAISGVLPREEVIAQIKKAIKKTYGKRGDAVVQQNYAAVDAALAHLHQVTVPEKVSATFDILPMLPLESPAFVHEVLGAMAAGHGDLLPVSALPAGGTFPTGTSKWETRNIAQMIPAWDEELCIQCGKCVMVCPHAVIRAKVYDGALLADAPATFKSAKPKWKNMDGEFYTLQVAPEDCTGCKLCVEICPVKSKSEAKHKAINMEMQAPLRDTEVKNWNFFEALPSVDRSRLSHTQVKDIQLLDPLFEFSGACAGCGETPYLKLLTQLFGDRLYIANATGCSSIYGGNLPTTPYTQNKSGRGPTWSNSLFEDNAEFGMGMRLALDQQKGYAEVLLGRLASTLGDDLVTATLNADQSKERRSGKNWPELTQCRLARCLRSPIRWCARACGLSVAMAGRTTLALAGWTMCWVRDRTSRCWCSIRRRIRIQAVRCRSPRHGARWRSLPKAPSRTARRISRWRLWLTVRYTWRGSRWAEAICRR